MPLLDEIKQGISCSPGTRPDSVVGRTVCIAAHPGKMAIFPFVAWFEKRYKGKYKFARLVFAGDLLLVGIAIGLAVAAVVLWAWRPTTIADQITLEATVAPREVVSGDSSTLVIRYVNGSAETLEDVKINLGFPDHFLLQELSDATHLTHPDDRSVDVGELKPGDTGSIKLRGVMFGDVGGQQIFTSTMTFAYDTKNGRVTDRKVARHVFSPVRSTLSLALTLPDKLVASQEIPGTITYKNTGLVDFPEISIEPKWPEGFTLLSSDVPLKNGVFTVPAIAAGTEGVFHFEGRLGDVDGDVPFVFLPSFTFGDTRYAQETLTHTATVVPLPIRVNVSLEGDVLRPGTAPRFTVQYENTGTETIGNVVVGMRCESPFCSSAIVTYDVGSIAPGESKTAPELPLPLRSSILQSETSVYENLSVQITGIAQFVVDGSTLEARSAPVSYPLVTPVVLDAFGRYTAPTGDQLGRGSLPPLVGEETTYWVFWNVRGTTNPINNVHIEGTLGPNVRFTGKQTVSQNGGVVFDPTINTISWTNAHIDPTLAPTAQIIGIAFELGLTPTDAEVGTTPTLLSNIHFTGTDAATGAFVTATGATVTTNLPNDTMAAGLGVVEK